jgi:anaerobic selenocysteine-containing dehydrogenase
MNRVVLAPSSPEPHSVVTYCRMCPAWCGVHVEVQGGVAVRLTGNRDDPLSRGYVCPKGRKMLALSDDPMRLDEPMIRVHGKLVTVDWDTALGDLGDKLAGILDRFEPYAIAMYAGTMFDSAGRAAGTRFMDAIESPSTYNSASLDSIAKTLVTRLMSGSDWVWPAFDFDRTSMLLILGENMVVSHGAYSYVPDPVRYLRTVVRQGEVWVLDPRRTETARLASHHLVPRAGTDFAVLAHLIRELLDDGADCEYLAAHARHTDDLRRAVQPFDRPTTARITGIAPDDLATLLSAVRRHGRLAVQTGTGVSMAANANVTEWMAFALQIVTGSFERTGGRWFNHQATFDPARSSRVKPLDPLHAKPGPRTRPELPCLQGNFPSAVLPAEIEEGHVRALLVIGGNPVTAFPQALRIGAALDRLDVLAAWDIVRSATVDRATHVFPCLDPLERADLKVPIHLSAVYAQYTPPVIPARAGRRAMWWSLAKLAQHLGVSILPRDPDDCSDDEVLAMQVAGTPVSWGRVRDASGPVSYPRHERWVEQGVLPSGRWDVAPSLLVAQLDAAINRPVHDLVLGNRRETQHTNSIFTWSIGGRAAPQPYVYANPRDAEASGVRDGDTVEVASRHGAVSGTLHVDEAVTRGTVTIPHGFSEPNVNHLTATDVDLDPLTGMPTLIGIPVTLRPTREATSGLQERAAGERSTTATDEE